MKKEINTLFALFRCAVFGEELCEYDKREAAQKASLLYAMARHHDLAHLVDYAYKISGIKANDKEAEFNLLKQQAMSVMRYENLNITVENISLLFEEERISFITLKGTAIRKLYPEPWMRTSCDIDILVREEDLDRAEKLLVEKLGFTSKGRQYHDISLYSDTDVHLELHFSIKENMESIDRLLSMVWEYASPKAEGSFEYVLTNEFLLFQHVSHMAYHVVSGGCGIRYFMDLYLLEKRLKVDNMVFGKMLEECELTKFHETSLKLANIWFSNDKHDNVTLLLQKYILGGGVYGTKKNMIAANNKKRSTVSYILNRIFMPYDELCIRYPKLKGKKVLLPFYWSKRLFNTINNVKNVNINSELNANNSVTELDTESACALMSSLGLKECEK